MMEKLSKIDIGDIIYLLLVGIGLFSSFFNKKKKNKDEEQTTKREKSIFETIAESFEKLSNPETSEAKPVLPKMDDRQEMVKKKKAKRTSNYFDSLANKNTEVSKAKAIISEDNSKQINKSVPEIASHSEPFFTQDELRKAFIYKEIINTPYID